jgi:ATP-dependent RNA helicase SUPV3L1/SUV3
VLSISFLHRKIKRIVFECVSKWDGTNERALSSSQMKQIAGRAGRYGLLDDDNPAGFVTTLYENDLPKLRKALEAPVVPLQHARIGPSNLSLREIAQALPLGSSTNTIYEAHNYIAALGKAYRFGEYPSLWEITNFIDSKGGQLTVEDRKMLMAAPIPWRDEACMEVVELFVRMYRNRMSVSLRQSLRNTEYMQTVIGVEEMMAEGRAPTSSQRTLQVLETFHRVLGLYLWLSFRNPVIFAEFEEGHELKERVEKVLEWSLHGVNASMKSKDAFEREQMYMLNKKHGSRNVHWLGKRQMQAKQSQERSESRISYVRAE